MYHVVAWLARALICVAMPTIPGDDDVDSAHDAHGGDDDDGNDDYYDSYYTYDDDEEHPPPPPWYLWPHPPPPPPLTAPVAATATPAVALRTSPVAKVGGTVFQLGAHACPAH